MLPSPVPVRTRRHDAIQNQACTVSQPVERGGGRREAGDSDLALPFPREIVVVVVAGIRLVTVGASGSREQAGFGRRRRRRRRLNCLILFQGKSASDGGGGGEVGE